MPAERTNNSKIRRYIIAFFYPFIITGGISLFVLPGLLHCLDTGQAEMNVKELANGASTRNITIVGYPMLHDYISLEETNLSNRVTSYTYYVPVANDSTASSPISCVLQVTGPELDELVKREKRNEPLKVQAVLRNLLWEGMEDDVQEAIAGRYKLADNVLLAEHGSQSTFPLWLCGVVFFVASLGSYSIITRKTL